MSISLPNHELYKHMEHRFKPAAEQNYWGSVWTHSIYQEFIIVTKMNN